VTGTIAEVSEKTFSAARALGRIKIIAAATQQHKALVIVIVSKTALTLMFNPIMPIPVARVNINS
jgi:hypothetical protein